MIVSHPPTCECGACGTKRGEAARGSAEVTGERHTPAPGSGECECECGECITKRGEALALAASAGMTEGAVLRQARTTAGRTQKFIAGKTGTHSSYFSEIETGARPVTRRSLDLYAEVLGYYPSQLLHAIECGER